jgi:hypothetical protein
LCASSKSLSLVEQRHYYFNCSITQKSLAEQIRAWTQAISFIAGYFSVLKSLQNALKLMQLGREIQMHKKFTQVCSIVDFKNSPTIHIATDSIVIIIKT